MKTQITDNIHIMNSPIVHIDGEEISSDKVIDIHETPCDDVNSKEWRLHFDDVNTVIMNANNYGSSINPEKGKLRVNVLMKANCKKAFKKFIKMFRNSYEHVLNINSFELDNTCLELSYKKQLKLILSADADKEQLKNLLNRQSKLFSIY